jgi:hypothetical protein
MGDKLEAGIQSPAIAHDGRAASHRNKDWVW